MTYIQYIQYMQYTQYIQYMQYMPQSCRKEGEKKTMPINHTAIISINYTTLPTRVFREQIIKFITRIKSISKVPETQT